MQISINPYIQGINNRFQYKNKANNSTVIQRSNLSGLSADTVSFTASSKAKVSDYLEAQLEADSPRLNRIATTYLDVLESVANKLKDKGYSFDREYCEKHPVKSPKSYTSKIVRSGTFKVPDTIRATLYCKNIYDLDTLVKDLLPEMKKRGYVLSNTDITLEEMIKRGYLPTDQESLNITKVFRIPDLDIRLENASEQLYKLSPEGLRYSISKPQKSGYEDIQMRFVREFDNKKNPVQHELIILMGPEYSIAKAEEYNKVYKYLREFEELNMKFEDSTPGSNSHKANRYMDLIKQMFRGKVSEKLFLNAKNKDLYDITDEMPITFSDTDIQMFENYFKGLKDRLNGSYKEARNAAKASEMVKRQLAKDLRQDKATLEKIQQGLKETIDYFNYKDDLNK